MSGGGDTGTSYNPTQTGQTFGNKLNQYLTTPAPVFGKPLYTGMGDTTNRGLADLTSIANRTSLDNGFRSTSNLVDSGGLTPGMHGNIDTTNAVTGRFGDLAQSLSGPGFAETGYRDIYNEQSNPQGAPGYQAMRDKLQNDVLKGVGSQFNSNGRFGGGSYVSGATDALVGSLGSLDYQNYQDAQNRRLSALSGYDTAFGNRFGQQMGALTGQQGAAGQSFGMGQQGISNTMDASGQLGQRYQDMLMPAQTIAGVGAMQDQDALAQRLGEFDQHNRTQNADFDRFSQLLGLFNGTQGNAGMQEQLPWYLQALGIAGDVVGRIL